MEPGSQTEDSDNEKSLAAAHEYVGNEMSSAIAGWDPTKQEHVDTIV